MHYLSFHQFNQFDKGSLQLANIPEVVKYDNNNKQMKISTSAKNIPVGGVSN